jgi:uncharacterized lipoprotein YmbA
MKALSICLIGGLVVCVASGCAGPPLTLYTLVDSSTQNPAAPLASQPLIVTLSRATIPDSLDSTDLVLRDGAILRRSPTGRWASRLSIAITDLLTAQLAARLPDALVTDQPQAAAVSTRLMIDISQFDITSDGHAVLTASWTIIPADTVRPVQHGRAQVTAQGATATDQDVVTLAQTLTRRLAAAIDVTALR